MNYFFPEGVENFHQKFTTGLCKMAVGFATYCGIERRSLSNVLQIGPDSIGTLLVEDNIFPFYPLGAFDEQLERIRPNRGYHFFQ